MVEISKHAKERYVERIMNRSDLKEITVYIQENEGKIHTDINKMLEYGTIVYTGLMKDTKKDSRQAYNKMSVIIQNSWVLIVDINNNIVVTLYKIDLGADEEFNKLYAQKMVDTIATLTKEYEEVKAKVENQNIHYNEIIQESKDTINELRGQIKKLEELVESYESIIHLSKTEVEIAEKNILKAVNKVMGKREY